jgi:hypothetical protein
MGIKDFGKLAKLKITPDSGDPFVVMFNPESYSQTYSTEYRDVKTINTGIEESVYAKTLPQDFKLKIIIDGVGVSDYNSAFFPKGLIESKKTVLERVKQFLDLAWYPQNDQAVPLEISWGEFSFKCVLKEVTINYTLFDREGNPLRAELDACFISDPEKLKKEYERKKKEQKAEDVKSGPGGSEKSTVNGIVISAS